MTNLIKLSPQQAALVEFAKTGDGNALVSAVAGSGKTSTLLSVLDVLSGSVAFAAYNKKIADEIESKVSDKFKYKAKIDVGTFHRFGRRAWMRLHPTSKVSGTKDHPEEKIDKMLKEYIDEDSEQVPEAYKPFVRKAYTLARQWGAGILPEFKFSDQAAWLDLVDHFDLEEEFENSEGNLPPNVEQLVRKAINWTVRIIKYGIKISPKLIDFEDMIYMPLRYQMSVQQFDWILVDECQDINPTRRAFSKKMLKFGGRAIFVGDPRQAIYGFTGADAKSFDNIRHEFGCKDFPLTWSFRCPAAVVRYAQQWVKHIESAPGAPEGEVRTIDSTKLYEENLQRTDAILCRNNAPLVDLFFALLRKGIPAHIEGKDIAGQLINIINRYKTNNIVTLQDRLQAYKARAIAKAKTNGKEEKAGQIADSVDAICAVIHNLPPTGTVFDLRNKIKSMFQDDLGNKLETLTLTSSHKSKGREWERVFWYGRNRYNPSPYARQDWQREQEDNLCYVSATRSKNILIDVTVPTRQF